MRFRSFIFALLLSSVLTPLAGAIDYLRIQDPQRLWRVGQGTIEHAVVAVKPVGVYMEYGIYLTFSARGLGFTAADTLEVQFQFEMPAGSIAHDSWLWIGDTIIRAEIMDKWSAEQIYEEIVNRRRDPSILFKRSETQYELRIFPMLGTERRKVKLSYLVPAQWTRLHVSAPLPNKLIRTSKNILSGMSVLTWPDGEWVNPRLLENTGITFSPGDDSTNGPHKRADVPWAALQSTATIAFDAPLTNGLYVNKHENAGGGYYQLALLPSATLGLAPVRKTAILVDHTAGTSSVTTAQVVDAIRQALHGTFAGRDSFNLIFSGASINRVSGAWLPADSATIDSVFSAIGPDPIASYSNLPALLVNGIEFIQGRGTGGDMLLIASSDQYGGAVAANALLNDLRAEMPEMIPVHVVNYQTMAQSSNFIGGVWYYGNDYFYVNLTRITGGNLVKIASGGTIQPLVAGAFQTLGGFITSFDLHTRVENGFAHSRYFSGPIGGPAYLDRAILQTGRYYGNFPMTVEVSGVYGGNVLSVSLTANDLNDHPVDSLVVESWSGNYVRYLESQQQTNDVVAEVIRTSLSERVLSIYSAFLALEPSRGGEVCYDCLDESEPIVAVEDSAADADSLELFQAWPNPFNASTTLRLRMPAGDERGPAVLTIYDVLGRQIRTFELPAAGSRGTAQVTWNGTDEGGATVNSGVYFAVYRGPAGIRTLKLMMVK